MTTWITAIAAGAAALFSFIGILLTTWSARVSQNREWRRDHLREVALKLLHEMDIAKEQLIPGAMAYENLKNAEAEAETENVGPSKSFVKGKSSGVRMNFAEVSRAYSGALREARSLLNQIDIVASAKAAQLAREWVDVHPKAALEITVTRALEIFEASSNARQGFVNACRTDFAVPRRKIVKRDDIT